MNQETVNKQMARRRVRDAMKHVKQLRSNGTVMGDEDVREQVIEVERDLEHLLKKIPFGCTQCAGCADQAGP